MLKFNQRVQIILDKTTPHIAARWVFLLCLVISYATRVWLLKGFYIVTYGLGIFNLNLVLGFLTPQFDPESEGPELPVNNDAEFKPFVRRLPEFKFWFQSTRAFAIGFLMTFFSVFDVPVFWPILLLYWFVLFFVTMKRQIQHMIKYRYLPFSSGKRKYSSKGGPVVKDSK